MLKEIEQLLILQDRDRKIRALRQELKNIPLERRALEEKLAATQKQLESAKQRSREVEVERSKLENEAGSKRTQIAKYQTQKFQTKKNEEFQALSNEIARYEGEVSQIEDRELALMELAESLKPQVAEAGRVADAARALVETQLADLETKTRAISAQVAEIQADRARLAEGVEEELLDTYQRLFAGKGEAVVPMEHDVCTGCHMKVTADTAMRARLSRGIVHCEQCGRILFAER